MNTETIIEKFQEQEIAFDLLRGDLMVNATEMAKPFNRRIDFFLKSKSTKALIDALVEDRKRESNYLQLEVVEKQILHTKEGQHGGTYMCEDLALAFAMWLSPDFHVWILKSVREIIFGNNPELVREAVMNMPRIQRDLDRLRRKRNKLKAVILGPDRRKEMNALINQRSTVNHQIQNLTYLPSIQSLQLDSEGLGARLISLIQERDSLEEQIRKMNDDFDKILIQDEYLDLVAEIGQLEKEQKHFNKLIRYSEIKFSDTYRSDAYAAYHGGRNEQTGGKPRSFLSSM